MSRPRLVLVAVLALGGLSVSGSLPGLLIADGPAAKKADDDKPRGRVPPYYGQLHLTSEQKTQIYSIQNRYDGRIDELLAQIEEIRVQRDSEIESVLSAGQRTELKNLLEQARRDREATRKETEAAKKAYEAKKKASGK